MCRLRLEGIIADVYRCSTDAIYPGKYTYQDDVTLETMGKVCMSNYDPMFSSIVRDGDILVSGYNL